MNDADRQRKAQTRWARLGPYLAMFPYQYAVDIIEKYTKHGDAVLDPFAGRFTSVVAAGYTGRIGVGIEISPLGYIYGKAKIDTAQKYGDLIRRISEISRLSNKYQKQSRDMGEFFRMCYCDSVLRFLLASRDNLNWKRNKVDITLMAQILTSLHHGRNRGLSNQMRQIKSMSPDYSIKWWKTNGQKKPPDIDPVDFLKNRLEWRYKYGTPSVACNTRAHHKDSTLFLRKMPPPDNNSGKFKLLLTSPPYHNMVHYYKDQWLRLWMLGDEPYPREGKHKHKKRFSNKPIYETLLHSVFEQCATMMSEESIIVVRTHARTYTSNITKEILTKNFPNHRIINDTCSAPKRQSSAINPKVPTSPERDLILMSR